MKLSRRQQRAALLPWVNYLKHPKPCSQYRSGRPMWLIFGTKGRTEEERLLANAKYRCKNTAHWSFSPLAGSHLGKGFKKMCWSHLVSRGIYGSMEEEARTEKWFYDHGVLCPSISPNGRRCVRLAHPMPDLHHTEMTRPVPDRENVGYRAKEEWTE